MPQKSWMKDRLKDHFLLKSRRECYRSRAAYKLQEINQKYQIISPGETILDLGAAPGSWTQIIVENLKGRGSVVSVDLLPIEPLDGAKIVQGDVREKSVQMILKELAPRGFDVIVSDMAPHTTGIHHADTSNSADLVILVLDLCLTLLKPGGSFVAKVFEGVEYKEVQMKAKSLFSFVKSCSPKASLSKSREIYLVALDFQFPVLRK